MNAPGQGPFTPADFDRLTTFVVDAWRSGLDRDWSVPAGTLEWSCFTTADHTVDCVFSYALFLASRRQDSYPPFGELHALTGAKPADLVEGLEAVGRMLSGVIAIAEPDATAILQYNPQPAIGTPPDFAARGALEMVLHAHDVCAGLGVPFEPPRDLCERLRDHSHDWPHVATAQPTDDPWADILGRAGRARVS